MRSRTDERDPKRRDRGRALELIDEANLPGLVVDPWQDTVVETNRPFREAFGWEADQVEGERWKQIVGEDHQRRARRVIAVLSFGNTERPIPVRIRQADGSYQATVWVGIPNLTRDRGQGVTLVVRPRGAAGFARIPPPDLHREPEPGPHVPILRRRPRDERAGRSSRRLFRG